MKTTKEKFFVTLKKLKSKKHEFALRESEVDSAIDDFMTSRLDIDFIKTDKIPDLFEQYYNLKTKLEAAIDGLNKSIETFKSVQEDYKQKADELGLDVEIIPEYGYIDTRIFESEEQIDLGFQMLAQLESMFD
jgi:predicted ribosome quality control (RQC) complex YloA/Tae2 family protein